MKKSRISQPVISHLPIFTAEGDDGWNLVVFRFEQRGKVIGYGSQVVFVGTFRFPGGRIAGYQGQVEYDTEEAAMADWEDAVKRAKRFVREQGGVVRI